MKKPIFLLLAVIILLLAQCTKSPDSPDGATCQDDHVKSVTGTFSGGRSTFQPTGAQLYQAYTDQNVTVEFLDYDHVTVQIAPLGESFEATCVQTNSFQFTGANAEGNATYGYDHSNKKISVTVTKATGMYTVEGNKF